MGGVLVVVYLTPGIPLFVEQHRDSGEAMMTHQSSER